MKLKDYEDKINEYASCCITSLKETSFDSHNNEFMTDSTLEVYNFDRIKDEYIKIKSDRYSGSNLRSCDALYYRNGLIVLLEFKNGVISGKTLEEEKLRTKIAESLLILTDILEENLTFTRKNCIYIFVYNKEKNDHFERDRNPSKVGIAKQLNKKISSEYNIIPYFHRYNLFFKKVYTVNEEELNGLLDSFKKMKDGSFFSTINF